MEKEKTTVSWCSTVGLVFSTWPLSKYVAGTAPGERAGKQMRALPVEAHRQQLTQQVKDWTGRDSQGAVGFSTGGLKIISLHLRCNPERLSSRTQRGT